LKPEARGHAAQYLWLEAGAISCIILHNMIVEDERDSYSQRWTDFEQSEESGSYAPQPYSTEMLPVFANHVRARSEFRNPDVHQELQAYLVKHIYKVWNVL
jgi:hypothetical protein